jgi:HEAT repeat protein
MKTRWLVGSVAAVAFGLAVTAWVLVSRRQHEALEDENPAIRAAAVRGLRREGNEQRLIERLKDEHPDVRMIAASRLGGSGPKGAETARALIPLLADQHAAVRREAAWFLGGVGPEALPALLQALQDENPRVRAGAALALRDVSGWKDTWPRKNAQALVPPLRKLLDDPDPEVSRHAKRALESVLR